MDHIETKILNSYTIQEAAQNIDKGGTSLWITMSGEFIVLFRYFKYNVTAIPIRHAVSSNQIL